MSKQTKTKPIYKSKIAVASIISFLLSLSSFLETLTTSNTINPNVSNNILFILALLSAVIAFLRVFEKEHQDIYF